MTKPLIPCRVWPAALALLICSFTAAATGQAWDSPRLAALRQDIQTELLARQRAAQGGDELFPGATAAFALPDGRLATLAVGFADLEDHTPMPPAARMPAGSIGKTFVAAVALSLAAEGALTLDAPIAEWLGAEPWFSRLPNADSITLRHLLNHSSGLIDHVFDPESGFQAYLQARLGQDPGAASFQPRGFVRFVLDTKPLFEAGGGFHYSDTNYILVGLIIEKASASSYYEVLTTRFLQPLGLTSTTPMDRRAIEGLVPGYATTGHALFGMPLKVVQQGRFVFDPSLEWTGGGLVSTPLDLVRWAKALFEGQAMAAGDLDEMLSPVTVPPDTEAEAGQLAGYGLGVSIVQTAHGTAYRHGGFFPGYSSMLAYYPDLGIAAAMQINSDNAKLEAYFDTMVDILVRAVPERWQVPGSDGHGQE